MTDSKTNPAVKKGDLIIMIESKNNSTIPIGKSLKVLSERKKATKVNFTVEDSETTKQYTVFYTGPADTFILATRENQIEYAREKLAEFEQKRKELDQEEKEAQQRLEFLEKYETEEDFVAEKLEKILTAHASSKTAKARTGAIAEILKELKSSDLL